MLPISRLLIFALCGVTGYCITKTFVTMPSRVPEQTKVPAPAAKPSPETSILPAKRAETSLLSDWAHLREEHGSGSAEMPALYGVVKEIKDPFRRRAFRAALLAEWAELDAKAALAF